MKLAHHTRHQWAIIIRGRLLALGCSPEYAEAEARRIREAS